MKKKIFWIVILIIVLLVSVFTGCSQDDSKLKNGYYTAEMSDFDHGWKEYVTICVQDGKIVAIEYNAKNASGFIKSWDMAYMRKMNDIQGTYPNEYTRTYGAELLATQNADTINIDTISGASHSQHSFTSLSKAVQEKAKTGDTTVTIVPSELE